MSPSSFEDPPGTLTPAGLREHLYGTLLPLWATHGWDAAHGGFHSRLRHDLRPLPDGYKRLVVQMRQLYCYSIAALREPAGSHAATADALYDHTRARFWDAQRGGWYLTTSPEGEPLDTSKDTYAHAFALLGLAHYHALRPAAGALELGLQTLDLLEEHLFDGQHGGFLEAADRDWCPRHLPRRHNPHMHLLEALLALFEVSGEERLRRAAEQTVDLLRERIYPEPRAGLPETCAADWSRDPAGPRVEPGHHFEWIWLLDRAERAGAARRCHELTQPLHRFAHDFGLDATDGAVFDQLSEKGQPTDSRKRVWPQTEHLKVLALELERRPRPEARRALEERVARFTGRYVDPIHGGWREQADRGGAIVSDAMNATTLYHVLTAFEEVARVLEETSRPAGGGISR